MLAATQTRSPQSIDELISPRLAGALDQIDLASRRTFAGKLQGERHSKARGRSVEFEDYRQYVPGDDLRHVDWNVFARLDRFFIKVFLEEQDLALHVAIDASPSMDAGSPNKLIQAQRIAMAMAYLGLVNNNRVVVWAFGGRDRSDGTVPGVRYLPPLRGRMSVQRVAKFILTRVFEDSADAGGGAPTIPAPSFSAALRTIAQTRAGRGVLVLLSDLLVAEGYQAGLSLLAGAAGWETTVLQVLSPGELDPETELDGRGGRIVIGDLRLTDAETGRASEVTVNTELLRRYKSRLAAYQAEVAKFLTARGIAHQVVRSDADVGGLMLGDLRRRGLVR